MRPLFHPAAEEVTVEGILHALSDPVRAQIFASIAKAECAQSCTAFLEVSDRTVPKSTLSEHFRVLRESGLIRSERKGVEMHNTARREVTEERFGKLITAVLEAHFAQAERVRRSQRAKHSKKS